MLILWLPPVVKVEPLLLFLVGSLLEPQMCTFDQFFEFVLAFIWLVSGLEK